ncbi:MAG: hypothetical protein LBD68_07550 [Zoogloeaceae bacterium]|nr:hypothetical protein [Zoogloeaceae bacterium]
MRKPVFASRASLAGTPAHPDQRAHCRGCAPATAWRRLAWRRGGVMANGSRSSARLALKFVAAVVVWLASSFVALNSPDGPGIRDSMPLVILLLLTPMVSFGCVILCLFDLGAALRASKTRRRRLLGVALGLPQFLFGLLCLAVGLAISLWVFYLLFVERLPKYLGGIPALGLLLLLLALLFTPTGKFLLSICFDTLLRQPLMYVRFGYARMISAFQLRPPEETPSLEAADKDEAHP